MRITKNNYKYPILGFIFEFITTFCVYSWIIFKITMKISWFIIKWTFLISTCILGAFFAASAVYNRIMENQARRNILSEMNRQILHGTFNSESAKQFMRMN